MERFHCPGYNAKLSAAVCAGRHRQANATSKPGMSIAKCHGCPVGLCHVQRREAPGVTYERLSGVGQDLGLRTAVAAELPQVAREGMEAEGGKAWAREAHRVTRDAGDLADEPTPRVVDRAPLYDAPKCECGNLIVRLPGARGRTPTRCDDCRSKPTKRTPEQNSAAFRAAVDRGVCINHVSRAVEPGTTRCAECNQRKRDASANKREERARLGLCRICGKNPAQGARCDECKAERKLAAAEVVLPHQPTDDVPLAHELLPAPRVSGGKRFCEVCWSSRCSCGKAADEPGPAEFEVEPEDESPEAEETAPEPQEATMAKADKAERPKTIQCARCDVKVKVPIKGWVPRTCKPCAPKYRREQLGGKPRTPKAEQAARKVRAADPEQPPPIRVPRRVAKPAEPNPEVIAGVLTPRGALEFCGYTVLNVLKTPAGVMLLVED